MNGIHDMGGMDGFGAVTPETDEPVFHHPWEARMFALASLTLGRGISNIDALRHAIERIPPARYLASSYYERWMQAAETLLIEHGILTRAQIDALAGPDDAANDIAAAKVAAPVRSAFKSRPRFRVGDKVRARTINPAGHTRLPRYVRGRSGVVRRDWGIYIFPDTHAHHAGENRQHVYSVEFSARELWGARAPSRDRVRIDLWEDYLEAVAAKPAPRRRKAKR